MFQYIKHADFHSYWQNDRETEGQENTVKYKPQLKTYQGPFQPELLCDYTIL